MTAAFERELLVLEGEKAHLEALLEADERWLTLSSLQSADPGARAVLENALKANPYFVARQKIIEVMSILASSAPVVAADGRTRISEKVGAIGKQAIPPADARAAAATFKAVPPVETELTLITGIDEVLAQQLAELGYTRCYEVMDWCAEDVRRISKVLDLGKRISRENWIEQAALRASRLPPRPAKRNEAASAIGEGEAATAGREGPRHEPADLFSSFSRPPLFDHRPGRVSPPFVARTEVQAYTPAAEAKAFDEGIRAPPAGPPEVSDSPSISPRDMFPPQVAHHGLLDRDADHHGIEAAEAEVVIVSSRGRAGVTSGSPPPIPRAAPLSATAVTPSQAAPPQTVPVEGGLRPPIRRLIDAMKRRDVDTTPYSESRGSAEEASVEIIRPKRP